MLDLAPFDRDVIDRAKSSFAVNVRALDAIHVATAELLAGVAEGSCGVSGHTIAGRALRPHPAA
jgi:hypothetical protein